MGARQREWRGRLGPDERARGEVIADNLSRHNESSRRRSPRSGPECVALALALILTVALACLLPLRAAAQSEEPVTQAEIDEIGQAFQGLGLRDARVVRGTDGRIALTGEYENRDEVEIAFAAARAIVGLRRVAPTTPANIKYRLKGFDTAFASTVGKMMQKTPAQHSPSPPSMPNPPPRKEPAANQAPAAQPQASQPKQQDTRPAQIAPAPSAAKSRQPPSQAASAERAPSVAAAVPTFRRGARTYGIIVGVGKFKHLPAANQLEFAAKDAFDFFNFLVSPQGGGLTRDAIKLLREEEATSAAMKSAMRDLVERSQGGDTVVLFAASHGLPNAMGKFDIVLHDTEFPSKKVGTATQSLDLTITNRRTALADDDLQEFVAKLALKDVRTVVVLDTCYSGKTFVSIPGYLPSRTRSLTQHKKEVEYRTSISQEALADLALKAKDAKTTRIVIVSASENEESMESPKEKGGLFTQTYINALSKIHDYADAFDQAKPAVIRSARTVGHSQTPRLLAVPETAETKM
jgi:hypothetical protein